MTDATDRDHNENGSSKHGGLRSIILLQIAVIIYSFSSVLSKATADIIASHGIISVYSLAAVGALVGSLGVYAVIWQRVLKVLNLSIAYMNKALSLVWSLLWAVWIFGNEISPGNALGVIMITAGILIITIPGKTYG